ncbi:MAG TPA: hypothetical protein VGL59_04925 [Polyangia bacterium]
MTTLAGVMRPILWAPDSGESKAAVGAGGDRDRSGGRRQRDSVMTPWKAGKSTVANPLPVVVAGRMVNETLTGAEVVTLTMTGSLK